MDPDMEELPTDYTAGVDFRLNKTSQKVVMQTTQQVIGHAVKRPLSDSEMNAVNTNGLV